MGMSWRREPHGYGDPPEAEGVNGLQSFQKNLRSHILGQMDVSHLMVDIVINVLVIMLVDPGEGRWVALLRPPDQFSFFLRWNFLSHI